MAACLLLPLFSRNDPFFYDVLSVRDDPENKTKLRGIIQYNGNFRRVLHECLFHSQDKINIVYYKPFAPGGARRVRMWTSMLHAGMLCRKVTASLGILILALSTLLLSISRMVIPSIFWRRLTRLISRWFLTLSILPCPFVTKFVLITSYANRIN